MMVIWKVIFVTKQCGHKMQLYPLTISPTILVVVVNQIPPSLGDVNSCWLPNQLSGKAGRKLPIPGGLQTGQWAGKWLLPIGGGCKGMQEDAMVRVGEGA